VEPVVPPGAVLAAVSYFCRSTNTDREFAQAEKHMAMLREAGHAVSTHYDRRTARVVVNLNTGVQVTFRAADRRTRWRIPVRPCRNRNQSVL
jgi:hypothetical protein